MKFKDFVCWCNERAADGCWGIAESICCINIIQQVRKQKQWKREKFWKENYRDKVVAEIVTPINKKIAEFSKNGR